jgi:hypothetical protein
MIMPTKHIDLRNSLLNVGAILIRKLDEPKTINELWSEVKNLGEVRSFEFFILGLDLLYAFRVINIERGLIIIK